MPVDVCLGKLPAMRDARIPRLSKHASLLPAPPASANWYADVASWGMLMNDQLSCCVEAAVMHLVYQQMCYTNPGAAPVPTDAEVLSFYELATGYSPNDPATDQGSYMLGNTSVMQFWTRSGVQCGGILNKPTAFLQVTQPEPIEWQQSVSIFGNLLIGLQLPESIVGGDTVPFVWADPTGPIAGGHEVLIVGYEKVAGETLYDLVSWGSLYRATEAFLLAVVDEAVTVLDPAFFSATGQNPAGLDLATLTADMDALRGIA
jgi:hypothetical protein